MLTGPVPAVPPVLSDAITFVCVVEEQPIVELNTNAVSVKIGDLGPYCPDDSLCIFFYRSFDSTFNNAWCLSAICATPAE